MDDNNIIARVNTPLGEIVVKPSTDPLYPGIYIDLHRGDSSCDAPLAMVECVPEGYISDKHEIITRVWQNAEDEGYSQKVVHYGIQEFFGEPDPNEEKYAAIMS